MRVLICSALLALVSSQAACVSSAQRDPGEAVRPVIAPAPAGPDTVFKAYSPFLTASGPAWSLEVNRRNIDGRWVLVLEWGAQHRRGEGLFERDASAAYPLHYMGTLMWGETARELVVNVVESSCIDASGRVHELQVAVSVEREPPLAPGCGEFHLPDPP